MQKRTLASAEQSQALKTFARSSGEFKARGKVYLDESGRPYLVTRAGAKTLRAVLLPDGRVKYGISPW